MVAEVRGDDCFFNLRNTWLVNVGKRRSDTGERQAIRLQHTVFHAFKMFKFILQLYLNSLPNDPGILCWCFICY